jgi:cytochrome c biogenesis protein CcmG/thiol:disulfide interchange protein DsbE
MKAGRLLYLLPLLTLLIMAGFFGWSLLSGRDPESIGSVMVNRPAPHLGVPSLRAGELPLADDLLHAGKPVLVNFFASWCAPCLAEHPLMTRLKEREGVTIVGIAWKNKPDEARAWLQRLGDPFKAVGYDLDGKLALDWGLSGVPETFLIDAQGIVRLHFRAPITETDLKQRILPLLKAGS